MTNNVRQTLLQTTALFLVCAVSLLSMQVAPALAAPSAPAAAQVSGRLSTRGNRAIVVNGNNTDAGATILDGAIIETPDGTGATVDLGPLGQIDLAPNTVAEIHYVPEQITVTLRRGCAIVRAREGVKGSIMTPDGTNTPADQSDTNNRKRADVCFPLGSSSPIVNTGAAANAGAGAGGGAGAAAGTTGAAGTGLSTGAIAAIVAGIAAGVITVIIIAGGDNESNSSPNVNF